MGWGTNQCHTQFYRARMQIGLFSTSQLAVVVVIVSPLLVVRGSDFPPSIGYATWIEKRKKHNMQRMYGDCWCTILRIFRLQVLKTPFAYHSLKDIDRISYWTEPQSTLHWENQNPSRINTQLNMQLPFQKITKLEHNLTLLFFPVGVRMDCLNRHKWMEVNINKPSSKQLDTIVGVAGLAMGQTHCSGQAVNECSTEHSPQFPLKCCR